MAVVSVAAVLAAAALSDDRRPAGEPSLGDVVRVGVAEGDLIPDYLRANETELAALGTVTPATEPTALYALVSFADYLTPDELAAVLAGIPVSEAVARVPLPDAQTEIVRIPATHLPQDVTAGMARIAGRKDREARDYRDKSAKLTPADDPQLHALYGSGARIAAAEAAAYRSGCACVYAAVVRAVPAELDRLARRPGVRTVDPAPEVRRLDRAVFLPPLPEQEQVARPPSDAVVSSATPSTE